MYQIVPSSLMLMFAVASLIGTVVVVSFSVYDFKCSNWPFQLNRGMIAVAVSRPVYSRACTAATAKFGKIIHHNTTGRIDK